MNIIYNLVDVLDPFYNATLIMLAVFLFNKSDNLLTLRDVLIYFSLLAISLTPIINIILLCIVYSKSISKIYKDFKQGSVKTKIS